MRLALKGSFRGIEVGIGLSFTVEWEVVSKGRKCCRRRLVPPIGLEDGANDRPVAGCRSGLGNAHAEVLSYSDQRSPLSDVALATVEKRYLVNGVAVAETQKIEEIVKTTGNSADSS